LVILRHYASYAVQAILYAVQRTNFSPRHPVPFVRVWYYICSWVSLLL
jgi:hypothetical protein